MKISVVNAQAPFIRGGAEYLADSLVGKLEARGHQVELVRLPFKWYPTQTVCDHMLACRLLKVNSGDPDLVIALKFPAYYVPFANKKIWLLHQFRQVYELWGPLNGIPDNAETRAMRDMVVQGDNKYLPEAKGLYTISRNVSGRLKKFNNIDADDVLYPPLDRPELFRGRMTQPYFFYPSRLNPLKRQHIAIEAMRHVKSNLRLIFAGKADSDDYERELRKKVEQWGLEDRVQFLGWVTEEDKARWMSNALGVVYLPFDEDYGYVTIEAFHSRKPLLIFSDSGGPTELVEHSRNGLILDPTPEALAEGMESLAGNRPRAIEMGADAEASLTRHRINWDCILDRLTA